VSRNRTRSSVKSSPIERVAHDLLHVADMLLPPAARTRVDGEGRRGVELAILSICLTAMAVLAVASFSRGWFDLGPAGSPLPAKRFLDTAAVWIAANPLSWVSLAVLLAPGLGALRNPLRFRRLKLLYAFVAACLGCLMLYGMWAPLLELLSSQEVINK
jgi:hypothetical protein